MQNQILTMNGDLLMQDVEVIVNAWNQNIVPWCRCYPKAYRNMNIYSR